MTGIKINISNKCKYNFYHIIVFITFIITCIKLNNKIDDFTIFVLFVILIQIILFCCINTNNHYLEIPPCCYIFIGFTNFSTLILIGPYACINAPNLKDIKNNIIYSIYLICLFIYVPTVLFLINWYYLSTQKYQEFYCLFYKPKKPKPFNISITLPKIQIPFRNIIFRNNDYCKICIEPYNPLNKKNILNCNHEICKQCLTKINSINKKCPFCKNIINIT